MTQTTTSLSRLERCPTCHRKMRRSAPQNAMYWALLHEMAGALRPQGKTYSAEQWHTYAKSRWLGCDEMKLPNGKTLLLPHSTAELDVAEFSEYVDKVEAFAADHGVWLAELPA